MSKNDPRQSSRLTRAKSFARKTERTHSQTKRYDSERGDSLIEVLLALIILGLAGVALIGAFTTIIGASAEHRTLSTSEVILKDFAESATYQIQLQQPTPFFTPCATLSGSATSPTTSNTKISYGSNPLSYQPPAGYTVTVTTPTEYLYKNTTFYPSVSPTLCDSTQYWPQLITATAQGPKGSASLSFVVSYPGFENYVSSTTTTTMLNQLHVSKMIGQPNGENDNWDAQVTIYVSSASGPIVGVSVSGSWGDSVRTFTSTCTTDGSGSCTVVDGTNGRLDGGDDSETFTVSGLALTSYTYNAAANSPNPATLKVNRPR